MKTDSLQFWKSVSHLQMQMLPRRRQRLRKDFSITSSASFFTNGCTTGNKRLACNLAKDNHELTRVIMWGAREFCPPFAAFHWEPSTARWLRMATTLRSTRREAVRQDAGRCEQNARGPRFVLIGVH